MKGKTFTPVTSFSLANHVRILAAFALTFSFLLAATSTSSAADRKRDKDKDKDKTSQAETVSVETCEIENFGKVNNHLFRGAQPEEDEYAQLAALGVKTVLDLRHDPKGYAKSQAEAAGLRYINLPMSDKKYPAEENIKKFLDLATDQSNLPLYVHCAGGRHRTGVMTAVYRMTMEGWDIERAYDEMKDYDFYTRWGHKPMKTFVFDYWKELQERRSRPAIAETQSSTQTLNK